MNNDDGERWYAIAGIAAIIFVGGLLVGGAVNSPRLTPKALVRTQYHLPDGATSVEQLGAGWHAFTLKVGGRPRRFLRAGKDAEGAMVELRE